MASLALPDVQTSSSSHEELLPISAIPTSPVRSLVSRFETKHEQSLDKLPFRTVRNFFDGGDERSVHVTAEKQKYDALMAKQRAESEARKLQRSPEIAVARKRAGSAAHGDPIKVPLQPQDEAAPEVARQLVLEFDNESTNQHDVPPPPPPMAEAPKTEELLPQPQQLINTPEQETRKKRPILTTERSFVMEEDHTIETEDMIVVGERFSTDGEDDREMLMDVLERQLRMTPQDEAELREAMKSDPARARMLRRAALHKYRRPENVPSKLFAPTAASLASRTTKNPSAIKREIKKPQVATTTTSTASTTSPNGAKTPTRKTPKYANVQSKVKEMMKPTTPSLASRRRASDASDISRSSSRDSMGANGLSTPLRSGTRASQQHNGTASADRRSFTSTKSSSSRRSSVNRALLGLDLRGTNGTDADHEDWDGRHRSERLSFASSTSSTDSIDPSAFQLAQSTRKSRYNNVQPRYLDYSKQSATYVRNKEAQQERRRKLEEVNAAKSADRQRQLQYQLKAKEKREREDLEQAVRRGEELHKMTQLLKEKEKEEDTERRKSQIAIRRALSGVGSAEAPRRGSSSVGASSPRTSLLSEPDSLPSSVTTANTVLAA
jgi:hypothetical protein